MSTLVAFPDFVRDAMEDQHERIQRTMERVTAALQGLEPTAPDPTVFRRVLAELAKLEELLERHFRSEEAIQYHGRIQTLLPAASSELQRLTADHRKILFEVRDARQRARHCSPVQVETLHEELEGVFELVRTHERAEDDLTAEAIADLDRLATA